MFGGNSFSNVLRHIGQVHKFDPGLKIYCGIDGCPVSYTNFESFRSHVYRKHPQTLHPLNMTRYQAVDEDSCSEDEPLQPIISDFIVGRLWLVALYGSTGNLMTPGL